MTERISGGLQFLFATLGRDFGLRFCFPLPLRGRTLMARQGALRVSGGSHPRSGPSRLGPALPRHPSPAPIPLWLQSREVKSRCCEFGDLTRTFLPFFPPCRGAGWVCKALIHLLCFWLTSSAQPLRAEVCFSPSPWPNLIRGWWAIHQHGLHFQHRGDIYSRVVLSSLR